MNVEKKVELVKSFAEEIISEKELRELFEKKKNPVAYDGFEPSGNIHIAQGILRAINIGKMTSAGVKFKMWVADWFAWMNNKLGGDLDKIQLTGNYLLEVWKVCGMDLKNVEFIWAKDSMADEDYWKTVVQIARNTTVKRIVRCSQIMGRSENESLSAAQIFYPCMQCADIFHLKADITQLGLDQRKVNVLAREIGPKLGFWKPVVVSHHMLMGLGKPAEGGSSVERKIAMKMSKSNPDGAIFMTDSENEIKRKVNKAYCPEKVVEENPVMEYVKYLIFERFDRMKIERDKKFGGDVLFKDYDELVKVYRKGDLHPLDLKKSVAFYVNEMVGPVRKHFEKNQKAKDLFEQVKSFKVTR